MVDVNYVQKNKRQEECHPLNCLIKKKDRNQLRKCNSIISKNQKGDIVTFNLPKIPVL